VRTYRKELWFNVPTRRAFTNITPQVSECLRESSIREGLIICNAMHITSSVFINDDESGLHHDYEVWLEKLAPHADLLLKEALPLFKFRVYLTPASLSRRLALSASRGWFPIPKKLNIKLV
jgi:hypothetical protein